MVRVLSFVAWVFVAVSSVYWGTQLFAKPVQVAARPAMDQGGASPDLSRLLGATAQAAAVQPAADARFKLLGVVATPSKDGPGVALIAVDGVPRALRVGAMLDGEWKLLGVERRAANIARDGQPAMRLELPAASEVQPVAQMTPPGQHPPAASPANIEFSATPPLPTSVMPRPANAALQ